MTSLQYKIENRQSGIILYGLTPPKVNTDVERLQQIAAKQMERIKNIDIDGLILYDLQDESSRSAQQRPFPFIETLPPDYYAETYLHQLQIPKIIYKSVGKFNESSFQKWTSQAASPFMVMVGAPSSNTAPELSLNRAYELLNMAEKPMLLGGVTIPERHAAKGNEHLRIIEKAEKGCGYFITQCVYDVNNAKNFLSDYYYEAQTNGTPLLPIIFSLTPCGSLKTLEFTKWLGIHIPKWLENDLLHAEDILSGSIEVCKSTALELIDFCQKKQIPIGFNIESVAIRKEEIEASIELLKWLSEQFKQRNINE